jgi:hypothetical protein
MVRWDEDQFAMQPVDWRGSRRIPTVDDEQRKVARDAYVAWQGSRYSVPWQYAGKEVWVRSRVAMWKSATAPNGSPCTPGAAAPGRDAKRASRGHPTRQ